MGFSGAGFSGETRSSRRGKKNEACAANPAQATLISSAYCGPNVLGTPRLFSRCGAPQRRVRRFARRLPAKTDGLHCATRQLWWLAAPDGTLETGGRWAPGRAEGPFVAGWIFWEETFSSGQDHPQKSFLIPPGSG